MSRCHSELNGLFYRITFVRIDPRVLTVARCSAQSPIFVNVVFPGRFTTCLWPIESLRFRCILKPVHSSAKQRLSRLLKSITFWAPTWIVKKVQKPQIFTEGAIGTARATCRSPSDMAYASPCISLHIRVCRLSIRPLVAETSSREATRVELFRIFHQFRASILTCKPYDANSHFSSSCHALIMHPSDPVSQRGDASIRPLQTVQATRHGLGRT